MTTSNLMLGYPARVTADGTSFMVAFPDIPEALTSGASREQARQMAADALTTAMDFYFEDRRAVPMPSAAKRGQVLVELPPSIAAKVLLLNEMVRQGTRNVDLARLMGVRPQEVMRLTNLRHPTKIDTSQSALRSLGRRLELRVV